MADGNSLGSDTQKRSWAFVYALLIAPENREGDPTQGEIRIVHKNWSDNRKNGHPALVVTAKKKPLIELIKKQKNILDKLSFTDEHFSAAYNTWLSKGKPFNILKDLRKNKKGVQGSLYHFELKLLANSTLPTDNEREFKKAWEEGKQSNREADSDCESFIQTSDPQCPNTITPPSIIYQNLPVPDYTTFVGRDKDVEQLLEFLSQPNVYRISVVGSGGLGKTRLVLEAVYRCLHASQNRDKNHNLPIFDSFIFTSAKQQRLTYKGLDTCTNPQSKIEDILRKIGDILEIPTINNIADQKELLEIIRKKLSYQQYDTLLIIDNLETMEDARNIHSFLYDELPTKLRVIVTSRQLLVLDKYIAIQPLKKVAIDKLINNLLEDTDISLNDDELDTLYQSVGGMPGAIMYAINLLKAHYSFALALSRTTKPNEDSNKFWFEGYLQLLRKQPAYYLLMALAMFPEFALEEAIVHVALPEADESTISEGFTYLQQLQLIKKEKNSYFILLPLTRSYVFGELDANSQFEQIAREGWINWYLQYSQKHGKKDEKEWNEYKDLEGEWENLEAVIEWCMSENKYQEFLQLWQNINGYSHAQGYYQSDRTTAWQNRLDWMNWLIAATKEKEDWLNAAKLICDKAWTFTLMGNKLKEAKSLFVEVCKISSKVRKDQDINFKFNLAIHIVYLRLKEDKLAKATFWLNFSKKLLQEANLNEETAKYQWVHIFYYRGKISDFSGDYEQAKFYYNQAIDLAETIGWKRAINMVKNWLADIAVKQGNLKEAKPMLEECLRVAEENSDKCSIAFCKESMAFLENKNGNLQEAIRLANLAYENFISLGMLIEAEATRLFIETIK